jgi:hypothetical protein
MNGELVEASYTTAMDAVVTVRPRLAERVDLARVSPGAPASRSLSSSSLPANQCLRCVWTSHIHGGRSCGSHVPLAAVRAAWRREIERGRASAGFFHFAWRGEAWLAYGMPDGGVRGVYCPTHRAEREERLGYDPELALRAAAGYAI